MKGVVLDAAGIGVAGARVGGGLSLVTTDATGHFTLPDVPLGRQTIVAVSDAQGSSGRAAVDLTRPGEEVSATIVLDAIGTLPALSSALTVSRPSRELPPTCTSCRFENGRIEIIGQAVSDSAGHYQMPDIPVGKYRLSAFTSDFSDGNLVW